MKYFLSPGCALKWLETPSVYNICSDELYELDETAFAFLKDCAGHEGCRDDGHDPEIMTYAVQEGILTPLRMGGRRPPIKKAPVPSLRYLELQITMRCNLRCRHCYIGPPDDVELPVETIIPLLREFEEMQGLRLLITGGEPLLYRRFPDLNELLQDYAFRKILLTNGTLLSREALDSLNVDEVQVSVDGLETGHDALRGKGTYRQAMRAIGMALDRGVSVSVSTMVHAMNLQEFNGMERLLNSLGIKDWTVDVPSMEGNLRENPFFCLEPAIAGRYLRYGFGGGLHGGGEEFACGLHLASVMADGAVAKCAFYRSSPVGTINEGLEACWKRIAPVQLDKLECDCDEREACRGGCRYRAGLFGSPLGKDHYRCFAYDTESVKRGTKEKKPEAEQRTIHKSPGY
jgi:radical SAM protein with 4Fe4S-binding SPASM domain